MIRSIIIHSILIGFQASILIGALLAYHFAFALFILLVMCGSGLTIRWQTNKVRDFFLTLMEKSDV